MKIYIHTDLEGISGITCTEQVIIGNDPQNEYSSKRLMADLNAAVDGAFAGGATQVTVVDMHRGGRNFIVELLDKRAVLDTKPNEKQWWCGFDESYDATMYIGAHAMVGTSRAFLCHTYSLDWHKYMINGRCFGELGMWAMIAGHFNVPLIMASGDLAACQEAASFFNPVKTAVVKHAAGINEAFAFPDDEAEKRIFNAAKESISLIGSAKPFKPILPMEIKIEYVQRWGKNESERVDKLPGVERIDGRTVRRMSDSLLDIFIGRGE